MEYVYQSGTFTPTGEAGKKFDDGKPRFSLVPPNALLEVVHVLTHGAEKYGAHNWKSVSNAVERYRDALGRHLNALDRGSVYDPETGRMHLAHVICCALFLIEFELAER